MQEYFPVLTAARGLVMALFLQLSVRNAGCGAALNPLTAMAS